MEKNMPFTNESDPFAQAYHAHNRYLGGEVALPTDLQTAVDARHTIANANRTEIANTALGEDLSGTAVAYPNVTAKVYSGGNRVTDADNRAGVDAPIEDTQNTEDLELEVLVASAGVNDKLFARGGFVGSYYSGVGPYYATAYSPYVDSLWLVEFAKQTGEVTY